MNCRRFHFLGTCGVIALLSVFFFTGDLVLLLGLPAFAYGLPWLGDLLYQRSLPLMFQYPVLSIRGDFQLFWEILLGRIEIF